MENALDVWNDLNEQFSQGDLIRVSELQQEIYVLKQKSKSVTEFYSILKILWEGLEIYMPIPNCVCRVRCSCEAMWQARKNHSMLYAIRFLTVLNENFSVVKSQILLMDPLPSMNEIFSMVLQHERQGKFASVYESQALINAVGYKKFNSKQGNSVSQHNTSKSKVCTHCGRTGHIIEVCYRKHGFPPHFGKNSIANNVVTSENDDSEDVGIQQAAITNGASPITQDHFEKLVQLIQNSSLHQASTPTASNQVGSSLFPGHSFVNNNGNPHSFVYKCCTFNSWIIDSGASDHICS